MLGGELDAIQCDWLHRLTIRDLSRDIYPSEAELLMYGLERNFIVKLKVIETKIFI